ncbi:MAG TPA: gamma carbonic anhydrase family protein [Pirellulales bacterium]|jgi:carbonic anhydrase/acetyltransferase-like protein (isoleucine patch superfamily)|nr:gamma carbonic anhydrase family protein [Pirellulales bacterium]
MADRTRFRPEQVAEEVFLAAGVQIVGDVSIGPESSVWFNAVVRGDSEAIRIGSRTNIQDNCVLHADPGFPCTLGDGVTVGHAAVVHGALIGDNVVIGMHAVEMNGAQVGHDSLVAVGAIVTERTVIPPGSLVVGLPGKVVRALTTDEIERNRASAEHYVESAKHFRRDDLRPQYEFDYSKARPNRFAARVAADTRAVVLDPDVAKVFTTPESVNAVLRALIQTMPRE